MDKFELIVLFAFINSIFICDVIFLIKNIIF